MLPKKISVTGNPPEIGMKDNMQTRNCVVGGVALVTFFLVARGQSRYILSGVERVLLEEDRLENARWIAVLRQQQQHALFVLLCKVFLFT
ncbi:hypothetical protein CDAR_365191 [Caerostris darwini]|uniref:Uncharacterized protein n=1 Tax=Caerostris darwini TaxID=1538125 RepID=A0AAV4U1E5_9ARAC|nr:hypothetical protein CDAR_365191 [Caerostris darwini]